METKTEPEQMRLIEETPEEKIHKLRQKVADTEGLLRSLEKVAKTAKDDLADFVLANMSGCIFTVTKESLEKLNVTAAKCHRALLSVMDAKVAVGNACAELAKAERRTKK